MKNFNWVIGASAGLGRQLCGQLAAKGNPLIISGSSGRDIAALAAHLNLKYNIDVVPLAFDLCNITAPQPAVDLIRRTGIDAKLISAVYFTAGRVHDDDEGLNSTSVLNEIMQINFTGPVMILNEMCMLKKGESFRIVVASSVAAIRARSKNIAYSSAKLSLENFCSGLMHTLAKEKIVIQVFRLGYMDTGMSYGRKIPFRASPPEAIAKQLINAEPKSNGIYYLPRYWFLIALVLKMTPAFIYKKLKF